MKYARVYCYLGLGALYLTLTSGACVDIVSFSAPNILDSGKRFQATVVAKNKLAEGTYSFPVYTHLSLDSFYNPEDVLVGESYVKNLPASATTSQTLDCQISANTTGGTWYLIAKADQNRNDLFDLEDYRAKKVQINGASVSGTDLAISDIRLNGRRFQPNQLVTGRFLLHNRGPIAAGAFRVRCQLAISTKTYGVQDFVVSSMPSYSRVEYNISFKIPSEVPSGGHLFTVVADYLSQVSESNELNNGLSVQPFVVQAGAAAQGNDERTAQLEITELPVHPTLSLAPNPSQGPVQVVGTARPNNTGHLWIFDNTGQTVRTLSVSFDAEGNLSQTIDLGDLPIGTYVASLRPRGEKPISKRLVRGE